jgi:hypothetical protein
VNSNIKCKINRGAKNDRFGNRFNANAFVFRSVANSSGSTKLNPNIGLVFEKIGANALTSSKINDTGGRALPGAAGIDINFSKIALGFDAQLALG